MEAYVPFIHHLKEIVCAYRETGIVSPRTVAASETFIESQNVTRSALSKADISLARGGKNTTTAKVSSYLKTEPKTEEKTRSAGPFECCGKTFKYRSQYEIHVGRLNHLNNVKCSDCHAHFSNLKELRQHKIDAHPIKKRSYICQICGALFQDPYSLSLHRQDIHHKGKCFMCTVCGVFRANHKRSLRRHMLIWHAEGTSMTYVPRENFKPIECCGRMFYYSCNLERHRASLRHQNKFVCQQCEEMFDSKEALKQHKSVDHFYVDGKFRCMLCNNKFATNGILTKHLNTVHGSGTVFECNKCSYECRDKWYLERHYKSRHLKSTPREFGCDKCGRKFKRKDHLDAHIKNIHSTGRHYCTTCAWSCKDAEALEKHKVTHNPCQICGMTFKLTQKRERHMKSHLRSYVKEKKAKPIKKTKLNENKRKMKKTRKAKKEKENLCNSFMSNAGTLDVFCDSVPETKYSSSPLYEDDNPDPETRVSLKNMPVYFNL
ncbi:hypothetical protein ONE63_001977 [Megalurothrips usitatus]|uniref:C2H2-type domain-containing protein n=1 Tax=Megalurothrips usitatus TaxID=439358 RepID=A0AAV7XEE7_9NEOP|nr:hypothetical protein ONE63_001977 [Megalurothrips usitatus]KAJ1522826.1 hypothetical protein ONE63_001977 [Megalurothrips usitatus]